MTPSPSFLHGAIELHAHASPSIFPRRQSDWELIADAQAAGMAGIVIKSHESQTADRATLMREKLPGFHVYGGLVCNYFTGGLSPAAVDIAIRLGAKIIWMPTLSSGPHQAYFAHHSSKLFASKQPLIQPDIPLSILDGAGDVTQEVRDILDLISQANIVLATGHLSPFEIATLVPTARQHGVDKILIQHPDMGIAPVPLAQQVELARQGVFLEKCALACGDDFRSLTTRQMAKTIEQIGPEQCVLVSDHGQAHNIPVVQALHHFTNDLYESGVSEAAIKQMIATNPAHLLGL